MAHITWKSMADELVRGAWGNDGLDLVKQIKSSTDSRLVLSLLIDVAQSLRALRCSNFVRMSSDLERLRIAMEGQRRDAKARRRR